MKYASKILPVIAVVAAGFAQPASAQQGSTDDLLGFYGGVVLGLATGENFFAETSIPGASDPDNFSGGFAGLTFGANMAAGNLIWGVEFDIAAANVAADSTTASLGCGGDTCRTSIDSLATLRARVGASMGGVFPYLTAGVALADVVGTIFNSTTPFVYGSDRLSGWTVGFGVERAFTPQISGKIEILHTDLGRLELPTGCGIGCYTDVAFTRIQIGLNFHF